MTVYNHDNPKIPRKRKRFTSAQLAMLETLFHRNSHPTREEREGVARTGAMEVKSVTIWFQNKRQTERRVALLNSTDTGRSLVTTTALASTSNRTHSPTFSTASSRPSLDSVASRTELRTSTPHTPTRRRDLGGNLWDNMPSSPIASPISPPSEYVEIAKNQRVRRTLEWACAAARVAEKEGGTTGTSSSSSQSRKMRTREQHRPHRRHSQRHRGKHTTTKADGDLTEEEPDETVTPTGSWIKDDHRWVARSDGAVQVATPPAPKISPEAHDDDVMRAALALCGLGRC
ncbi:homeodomain transcription factor [Amanita muscaria]